jgi:DnaJ-class molecular chaperone
MERSMRDPYEILGIPKTAGGEDVKRAFRRLAKRFHPDQNKSDPKAKEKFAEANAAYEILGDEKKRRQFDRGEIDAEGKPKFQGFEGFGGGPGARSGFEHFEFSMGPGGTRRGGFDPSDIISDLFGGLGGASRNRAGSQRPSPARGEDVAANVTVGLSESVKGTQARVELPTGRTLDIAIPAGIADGKQIRLKGQGHAAGAGGTPGDAIVTVRIAKHPYLTVDGRDLRLELPVSLYEVVLGAKVTVPTLEGAVELAIPPGSNGGKTLRLRSKGLPGSPAGDLLVSLRIVLPAGSDPEFQTLMQRWRTEKPYDPRNDLK